MRSNRSGVFFQGNTADFDAYVVLLLLGDSMSMSFLLLFIRILTIIWLVWFPESRT